MKKLISFFNICLILLVNTVYSQSPQGIPYQAIARNSSGSILSSHLISVRFTIHDSVTAGTIVYQETFSATTTALGLFNVNVGTGTVVIGTFSNINWGVNAKFMQVEMDPTGGASYIDMGTSQMMSVPYALYAPNNWSINGNSNINTSTNFIGTTNNNPFRIRVNNQWAGELNPNTGNASYGTNAGISNIAGFSNIAIGTNALYSNINGSNLVAIGDSALYYQNGGYANVALGSKALFANTTGFSNTATGYLSLNANTTGAENTAFGRSSLAANTTGNDNTANGMWSLTYNTTGFNNTAIGSGSLMSNTTGSDNDAIGKWSLTSNTTGIDNVSNGSGSLFANTTGNYNTASGFVSLSNNTTGVENTGFGRNALASNITGNDNTALGNLADVGSGNLNNAMVLGNGATVNSSNTVVIGNTSIATIGGYQNWTNLSDGRFKSGILENVPGLDFILKLRPVTYHFEARKFEKYIGRPDSLLKNLSESYDAAEKEVRTGFVAQEVEKAAQETGYDFSGIHKPTNDKDNYSLAYAEFTVPLVKAVQEQQKIIEKQQQDIKDLKQQLENVLKQLKEFKNNK